MGEQGRGDSFAVEIGDALPGDCEALSRLALRSKAHWGYDSDFISACRAELTLTPGEVERDIVRKAQAGNRIAGFYHLTPKGTAAEIEAMFVDPAMIRQGIGRALWHDLLARVRQAGLKALQVDSDPHAEGYYRRMGMRRAGQRPSGSVPGRHLPFLVLSVPAPTGAR